MEFKVFDLGLTDFKSAAGLQRELALKVENQQLESALILCQHYPVITLGRQANRGNILVSQEDLREKGIAVYAIERGGDVTYHGLGQIVAYPIFNLALFKKDIHLFLRTLEEVVIGLLSEFGVKGIRRPPLTGVWINKQKISSIGIAIKNWVSFHGLSINIKKTDLPYFNFIRPCGMDIEMTTLESLLNREIDLNSLKQSLIGNFKILFG